MNSIQSWLPFLCIEENGIIKLNNNKRIKILKINPINYELMNSKEKEVILDYYKKLLIRINFDIQIIIQSKKQNINNYLNNIKNYEKYKSKRLKDISDQYINYLKKLNEIDETNNKEFYLIISEENNKNENIEEKVKIIKEELENCGNYIEEINDKEKIKEILLYFINKKESIN